MSTVIRSDNGVDVDLARYEKLELRAKNCILGTTTDGHIQLLHSGELDAMRALFGDYVERLEAADVDIKIDWRGHGIEPPG